MSLPIAVPDGTSGIWSVETFSVSEAAARRSSLGGYFRYCPAGTYKRLCRGGTVVMSNTPMEISTNGPILHHGRGHVLVNGLGLGMVVGALLGERRAGYAVTRLTVIEVDPDVIALVAPTYAGDPRLEIIEANALSYQPPTGVRYNAVWHDIFDDICTDNLPQIARLKRKYGRRCDWQEAWCEDELRRMKRRYLRGGWY